MQFLSVQFMLIALLLHAAPAYSAPKFPKASSIYRWCDDDYRALTKIGSGLQGGDYHFCGGLEGLYNIYTIQKPDSRRYAIEKAIGEFSYMIANNPRSTHPFLAEVHLYRATALRLAGRANEAAADFTKAIEINPGLAKAYHEFIGLLVENKQKRIALQYATQALRYFPETPIFQRHYTELGGQLPYPEPINKPVTREAPQTSASTSTASDTPARTAATPAASGSAPPADKPTTEIAPPISK